MLSKKKKKKLKCSNSKGIFWYSFYLIEALQRDP